jgi:Fic family protein
LVAIIRRKKGNQYYYYLRHNTGKTQKEIYLGVSIPKNIEQLKRQFYLDLLRQKWIGQLETIGKQYRKFIKDMTKPEERNQLEVFSFDFTHDTNKIEGSTLTRTETRNLLRFHLTPSNKPEHDTIEANNHHRVFLQLLQTKTNLSLNNTLKLHKEIFTQTKPQFAGLIRKERVFVTGSNSSFPHPRFVPALLKQFFSWCCTVKSQNPVEIAALAHFRFVSIHPFGDGNGRISRLLMNHVLHQHGYPMLNIKFAHRRKYYSALEKASTELDEAHFLKWFVSYYVSQNRKYLKDHS